MSEAEHLADWLDQAATAADLGRPKVKTDNRRLAAKALRKQQAEIDALRAKLAALEGAYIPTYLERLAASPATLEAEFAALRSEALDLRSALAERDARLAALEKQEPVGTVSDVDTEDAIPYAVVDLHHLVTSGDKLYAAAGAAPVPCVVLTPEERAAFERFHETWEDNEGYDVPKEMMRRLAEVGVVHHITAGRYDITKFGHYVLAAGAAPVPDGYRLVSIAQLNTWGVYDEETTPKDAP